MEARAKIMSLINDQGVSAPEISKEDLELVNTSIRYLESSAAEESLASDPYWPKWDSPWWHAALLYEMGFASKIPSRSIINLLESAKAQYVDGFFLSEVPTGRDPIRDTFCLCGLGNLYQISNAAGVDVDQYIPWARDWLIRYQMDDGGMSCDVDAYAAKPQASSIVGTIAPLEAILSSKKELTSREVQFLKRGALSLLDRKLLLGCKAEHNAEERLDEEDWKKLCFPRFYLYDVMRGLRFILRWADSQNEPIPASAIVDAIQIISSEQRNGSLKIQRHSFEGVGTRVKNASGDWIRQTSALFFPLLNQVSNVGKTSPYLTRQWNECRDLIQDLDKRGLIQ